jgi:archaellum component FlaC
MDPKLAKEVERLAADAVELGDEIELASEDDATPEVIEQARRMMADFLDQYNSLLDKLEPDDKAKVQRSIGNKVERFNNSLSKLR